MTLVEVMIAIVVIALVFLSVFAALGQGFSLVESSRDHTRALHALQDEVDTLRSASWVAVSGLGDVASYTNAQLETLFPGKYTFSRDVDTPVAGKRKITITMSWVTQSGEMESMNYFTVITEGGLVDLLN